MIRVREVTEKSIYLILIQIQEVFGVRLREDFGCKVPNGTNGLVGQQTEK